MTPAPCPALVSLVSGWELRVVVKQVALIEATAAAHQAARALRGKKKGQIALPLVAR